MLRLRVSVSVGGASAEWGYQAETFHGVRSDTRGEPEPSLEAGHDVGGQGATKSRAGLLSNGSGLSW